MSVDVTAASIQLPAAKVRATVVETRMPELDGIAFLNLATLGGCATFAGTPGELLNLANRITEAVVPLFQGDVDR